MAPRSGAPSVRAPVWMAWAPPGGSAVATMRVLVAKDCGSLAARVRRQFDADGSGFRQCAVESWRSARGADTDRQPSRVRSALPLHNVALGVL